MCLLIVASRLHPDLPLIVGANRDEWLERPASPMEVLRRRNPRILGGRDLLAGGTWMAVNRRGVVAALTNRPTAGGRDMAKRSRGELPLLLAAYGSAAEGAAALVRDIQPAEFNPCWILVGDRHSLFYLELSAGLPLEAKPLEPGLRVLENRPLPAPSPKVDWVRSQLPDIGHLAAERVVPELERVLRSNQVPPGALEAVAADGPPGRPLQTFAPCVHAGPYGTRSSMMVLVPRASRARPGVRFTDGAPCVSGFQEATSRWSGG
jgi:uncharacterized protein with NRDE domain